MFYLIPMSILAYNHRNNIGYYILKTYSYLEIQYNRWYKSVYYNPEYKFFINGKQIDTPDELSKNEITPDTRFEIEYPYKNKSYRIAGKNIQKIIDFLDNKDDHFNSDERNPKKVYRWIAAVDENNSCYLDVVKKYAGPNGNFYLPEYETETECLEWLKNKKLIITDFRLDEYVLDGTTQMNPDRNVLMLLKK